MSEIKVIETYDRGVFEKQVNDLLEEGYSVMSLSCKSENYKAILIHK